MARWEALDPTGLVHALDQGAHLRLFFLQPEAVDLFRDETLGFDIQAFGAVRRPAPGWNQTRGFSRRAKPRDHAVNGRSVDTKLAAHGFDDRFSDRPIVRFQQAPQENVPTFGFKPARIVRVVEETWHVLMVRSTRWSSNPN